MRSRRLQANVCHVSIDSPSAVSVEVWEYGFRIRDRQKRMEVTRRFVVNVNRKSGAIEDVFHFGTGRPV